MLPLLLLLGVGGCPEAKSPNAQPPSQHVLRMSLERAVRRGDSAEVARLLEQGAQAGGFNSDGEYTMMHDAALGGDLEIASMLTQSGAEVDPPLEDEDWSNGCYALGTTPLAIAANLGQKEIVELLLDGDADPTSTDEDGRTPAHMAAARGHRDIMDLLIASGADAGARSALGYTPLDYEMGHWCAEDDLERASTLLDQGADPNVDFGAGLSLVHDRCLVGAAEGVQLLIEYGADIEVRSEYGETPLQLAAAGGDVETVQTLLARGADAKAIDYAGRTALHHCLEYAMSGAPGNPKRLEILKLLISAGANADARNERGHTAFDMAREYHCDELAEYLDRHTS
jgi:ankyrin repeat protein